MGVFKVKAKICGSKSCEEQDMLIDTGSMVTMVSKEMAERIGVDIRARGLIFRQFTEPPLMGDLGVVDMHLEGKMAPVIVGVMAGVEPVIGATTLEILGFEVDPVEGRLKSKPLRV